MYGKKRSRLCLFLILIFFTIIPFLFGCSRKGQPQKKPAVNGSQEIKIAVSLADMERDGNQIIKKTMTGRQGQNGQQGGQSQQGSQQGGQGQSGSQQAGLEVVPVQAGGQGGQGQAGSQQGQAGGQGQQRVNITWLDAKNDPAQQEKDLEQLKSQNVKAVVLQAVDPSAAPRLVRKLAQANIKVIALETLPADSPLDGYIATDHARTGELMARYLLSAVQGRTTPLKTVILQGDKNDQVSRDITSSALENLKDYPVVQVVLVKEHPRGDPQSAAATLDQVLAQTNNRIDAVLAVDSRMAAAATDLLKKRGLEQQVITVGVGADQQSTRVLVAGEHDAEIDVMPDLIAQYIYDAAVGLATTGYWQNDTQVRNGDFDIPAKIAPVRLIGKREAYLLEQRWSKMGGQQEQAQQNQQGGGQGNKQSGNQAGGNSDSNGSGSGGNNAGGGQGEQNGGGRKTTLRITTQDGKTVEMQINGEIKKIETIDGGGAGEAESAGQGQGGGSSQS